MISRQIIILNRNLQTQHQRFFSRNLQNRPRVHRSFRMRILSSHYSALLLARLKVVKAWYGEYFKSHVKSFSCGNKNVRFLVTLRKCSSHILFSRTSSARAHVHSLSSSNKTTTRVISNQTWARRTSGRRKIPPK